MIIGIYLIWLSIMIPVWIFCWLYTKAVKRKQRKLEEAISKQNEEKATIGFTTEKGQWK